MATYNTIKSIATGWIKKGDAETNSFNKFIAYWIAFNCFYSWQTGLDKDTQAIKLISSDTSIRASYKLIVNAKTTPIFKNLQLICPIYNVSRPGISKSISNIYNMKQVVEVLYLIRCNLFHGDKGEDVRRDKRVVNAGFPVLELIVKKMIQAHI